MNRQSWKRLFDWPISSTNNPQGVITPETSSSSISDIPTVIQTKPVLKNKHSQKQRLTKIKSSEKKRSTKSTKTREQNESKNTFDSDLNWDQHPEAWAYLVDSNKTGYYLLNRHFSNERKGYLIGSDSLCDLIISDDRIQPRHCLIYAENFTNLNNQSSIRVYLKDLSEPECPTLISVNGTIVQKISKEPVWLQHCDHIRFISSKDNVSRFFAYRISLCPNIIAKTFDDEFSLGPMIGRGAFAQVLIAKLKNNKSTQSIPYVVKIIDKEQFKYKRKALRQFEQEISILMLLEKHPGIVGIIKAYDSIENFHIVMDYISEGDLYTFIKACGRLSEDNTRTIFKQLFNTIKFLHDAGVVHRDLKPENIMMANKAELQVKICDFGLATLHQNVYCLTSQCGTDNYVAPEILNLQDSKIRNALGSPGEPTTAYGKECDLWSLGVILYICLSGEVPFYDRGKYGPSSKKRDIIAGRFDFNDPIWEEISLNAKQLIQGLLTVDRNKRMTVVEALAHPWFIHQVEQ